MYLFKKILFVLSTAFFCLYAPYQAYINHSPSQSNIIEIDDGSSINNAVSNFSNLNFINKIYLKYFIYINNIESIKAGEYFINNKKMKDILFDMVNENTVTHKFVIKEGSNIYQLSELINNSKLINDCKNFECLNSEFPFIEGTLYPDTYFYKKGMKVSSLLKKSQDRLIKYLNSLNLKNKLNKQEVLILASIIEKEAGNNEEKLKIAGVFLRRLNEKMRLQADPTIIYGLLPNFDGDIKRSNIIDKKNKYNTYMINGLPPTPIAISSISSINAAVNGQPGEFLFFVANSNNSHYFSKTYKEHQNKIEELGLNK